MSQANELQRKAVWFLPYRGEFGHKVMWYAPFVQGFPVGGRPKVVICEYGEEALFPGCATIPCGRREDPLRREWSHDDAEFIDSWRQSVLRMGVSPAQIISPPDGQVRGERHPLGYFAPVPSTVETGFAVEDWPCDVVICPRRRSFGDAKNWTHWPRLAAMLAEAGLSVVAAGAPDSSAQIDGVRFTGASGRPLDATLAAMHSARAVVATDAGLAHLAVACGRPLVMISCGPGLTAPGYRPIRMDRYHKENHAGSPIHVVTDAWDAPERVVQAVREVLAAQEAIPC